ncbi:Transposase IS4 [Popillia japonica]|uniref:Transposase IS4 n=1 Tax=Popillia japonica TaxID=7064 RepID=A0AAW1MFD8_POPJA
MPDFGPVGKGDCEIAHNDKILALKWYDKRVVHMLTSVGTANMTETGKTDFKTGDKIMKPACIIQYNSKMGAIDKVDMQAESSKRRKRWNKEQMMLAIKVVRQHDMGYKTASKQCTLERYVKQINSGGNGKWTLW